MMTDREQTVALVAAVLVAGQMAAGANSTTARFSVRGAVSAAREIVDASQEPGTGS